MTQNGVADCSMEQEFLEKVREEAQDVTMELVNAAGLVEGDVLVVGCSSSEVVGEKIGTFSSVETAQAVFDGIHSVVKEKKLFLAAQCCEHLNRALIVEKEVAKREKWCIVNVIPVPKAGGSFATTAYERMDDAVAVESVKAQAGIDIGDTLIGMHLDAVAVPVRTSVSKIGNAHVVCARTRAKFVGGSRAVYDEKML